MNGEILTDVRIFFLNGTLAYGARAGDIVEGDGNVTITRLTRNGTIKLSGTYRIESLQAVRWEGVPPPPPDPTPEEITLKHIIEVYSDGSLAIDGTSYP